MMTMMMTMTAEQQLGRIHRPFFGMDGLLDWRWM
jgi:hypothetical protein